MHQTLNGVFEQGPEEAPESNDPDAVWLRHFAQRRLRSSPSLILTENKDIEALCALVHLGQANAVMQVVFDPRGGGPQIGLVVSEISPNGWEALRIQLGQDKLRRWRSMPSRDLFHDSAGEQA